jgi:hypothetical protein
MSPEKQLELYGYGLLFIYFGLPLAIVLLAGRWRCCRSRGLRFAFGVILPWFAAQMFHAAFISPLSLRIARAHGDPLSDGVGASAFVFLFGFIFPTVVAMLTLIREAMMPNFFPMLCGAILDDDQAKVKELLEKHAGLATHGVAVEERYEPRIAHWIYSGDRALHVAAAGYRVDIARMLLAAGADARAARNRRHSQALHYAADGHRDSAAWDPGLQVMMIRLLLEAGAEIDAPDKNGATPLHRAVRTRCATAVKCLLDAGADPTVRNKSGSSPFHLAVQNTGRGGSGNEEAIAAQREIIGEFRARGISPRIKDGKGKSVSECATSDWIRKLLSEDAG